MSRIMQRACRFLRGKSPRLDPLVVLRTLAQARNCNALRTVAEIEAATKLLDELHLPHHHDPQKNWDCLKALVYLLETDDYNAPVLDAGSSSSSTILNWLARLGYRNLHACDIRATDDRRYAAHGIRFTVQDLTQTNFPAGFFRAVTCLSVIEHGVPLAAFLHEMARILRPGGLLLASTDYWSEPIDCTGLYPYGPSMGEMKVFKPSEIQQFCESAAHLGFRLCSPLDLATRDRAVRWERVARDYTFIFLAFRRSERP
jgi:SAM-dependent methyltransferase